MWYVTIDKSKCFGMKTCGECIEHISSRMHSDIFFHGVLLVSHTRWNGKEGESIREAIKICPVGAVVAEQ